MFAPIASVCVQLLDQACQLRDKASNVLLSEKTKQQRCFRDPFAAASAFPIHGPVDRDHPPPAQGRGCKFHWFLTVARLSQTSLQGPFLGCPPEHLTCPHHGVCYVTPAPPCPCHTLSSQCRISAQACHVGLWMGRNACGLTHCGKLEGQSGFFLRKSTM